jgi:hypothetical protein
VKNRLAPILVCAVISLPTLSVAADQSPVYGGMNYHFLDIKDETGPLGSFDNGTLSLTLGYRVHRNLAIEGSWGAGVNSQTNNILGKDVRVESKDFFTFVLRPQVPITPTIDLYGRAGYFNGKFDTSNGSLSLNERDHDFAYGLGLAFYADKGLSFTLDYTQFYDRKDTRVRGLGIGASIDF